MPLWIHGFRKAIGLFIWEYYLCKEYRCTIQHGRGHLQGVANITRSHLIGRAYHLLRRRNITTFRDQQPSRRSIRGKTPTSSYNSPPISASSTGPRSTVFQPRSPAAN